MKIKHILLILIIVLNPCTMARMQGKEFSFLKSSINLYGDNDKTLALNLKIPSGEFRFSTQQDKTNFGLTATSEGFCPIPFTLRTGNLNTAGSLSRLNSPLLTSSSSPFSTGFSDAACILTSLPGTTSFTKPLSTFMQISCSPTTPNFSGIKINVFYNSEDPQLAFSSSESFQFFQKRLKIKTSITGGFFHYDEQTSSSWFIKEPYYPEGNHFCSLYQLSINYLKFSTTFSTGVYETPFGTWSYLFRTDNKFSPGKFIFNLSCLYNPNSSKESVITSVGKTLKDCLQFKNGLQYKFSTGSRYPVFIKTGLQNFLDINLSQKEHPIKLAAGTQITTPLYGLSFSATGHFVCNTINSTSINFNFEKTALQIKTTLYFQYLLPSFAYSFSLDPSEDYSHFTTENKFSLNLNYEKITRLSSTCNFNIKKKSDGSFEKKLSLSSTATFSYNHIHITLKFSANNTL